MSKNNPHQFTLPCYMSTIAKTSPVRTHPLVARMVDQELCKNASLRAATCHAFPNGNINDMLREIEEGKASNLPS